MGGTERAARTHFIIYKSKSWSYGILSLYVTPIIGGSAVDSSNLDTFLSTAQPRSLRDRTEKHGAYSSLHRKWQALSLNVLDFPMFNTRLSRFSIKRLPLWVKAALRELHEN